jgi:hypothetical protein
MTSSTTPPDPAQDGIPEFQDLSVGDWVPKASKVNETTAFKITVLEPSERMLWERPNSTWAWTLKPLDGRRRTRLVTRTISRESPLQAGPLD